MKKIIIGSLLIVALTACGASSKSNRASDSQQIAKNSSELHTYIPKNHVELNNYNKRQQIADDPTTILWCTFAFPVTGSPLVTVPIVGKLTSGNKRPFPSNDNNNLNAWGNTETPGADGMFGTSGDYSYGFDPTNNYQEFRGSEQPYCTTAPTIWQKENTTLSISIDTSLNNATKQAQNALKNGNPSDANQILSSAIKAAGGK